MIITIGSDSKSVVFNDLVIKEGKEKEIEYLHKLYSTPNFELGYLQHGGVWFHQEEPKEILITKNDIQVYDSRKWRKDRELYPVEYFTTRAKSTLFIIRQLLKLEYPEDLSLKDFFADSFKEVGPQGFLVYSREPDFSLLLKKLNYILKYPEIALSLLKDAYLDFYLFVDLLTKVDFKTRRYEDPEMFNHVEKEATENTQILNLARCFNTLMQ